MATLDKALEIAAKAHAGQTDRQGQPYILHPIRVMMGVQDEAARIVGILHDVVEDTAVTLDELRSEGFSAQVIESLKRVTHQDGQTYAQYVVQCKSDAVSRDVKLSDLRDNANLSRLRLQANSFDQDSARMHRYALSYQFLTDQISESDYLRLMGEFEK
ncbi:HD domain-containing protein [Stieleria sp. TO1_6]|uniref:HD domain-containing protein n=1 Tax=Stieleria tagensis TaxID=2956795 RepID=UPI00209B67B0|nr:HD domain-containing protein [Stieleria tagensis]MCO8120627.1 HD domain-containing protein [Stieleria tagensis]